MKYLIQNMRGETILSNLDPSELEVANSCKSSSEQILNSSTKQQMRHGKLASAKSIIYLSTNDQKITGKIFKKYQEIFTFFLTYLRIHILRSRIVS